MSARGGCSSGGSDSVVLGSNPHVFTTIVLANLAWTR